MVPATTLTVVPGEALTIYVGAAGTNGTIPTAGTGGSGFGFASGGTGGAGGSGGSGGGPRTQGGGGGGGGGASAVVRASSAAPLIVAAGGGGGGGVGDALITPEGGDGGNANSSGDPGSGSAGGAAGSCCSTTARNGGQGASSATNLAAGGGGGGGGGYDGGTNGGGNGGSAGVDGALTNGTGGGGAAGGRSWRNGSRYTPTSFNSTGAGQVQLTSPTPTTTTLSSSVNPSVPGQSVTFTATVTPQGTFTGTLTGTVTFLADGVALGSGTLDTSGVATFTTSTLAPGSHTITAEYVGSAGPTGFASSTSDPVTQQVIAPTTTALQSSPNPSFEGQPVTFTATVTSQGAGTPTGTVTFFEDGTQLGGPVALVDGVATFTTSGLSVGEHAITAVYGGSTGFATSTSNMVTQVVNAVAPGLQLVATADPVAVSAAGQTIAYAFTVTNTGNVTIDDLAISDSPTPPAGTLGSITCDPDTLPPGAVSTCTGSYTVSEADIGAASGEILHTFTATGSDAVLGGAVDSNPFSVAVDVRTPQPGWTAIVVNTTNTVGLTP